MQRKWVFCSSALIAVLLPAAVAAGQIGAKRNESREGYTLRLPVDEVVLTFHAADADGVPINDLKAQDIQLWDNGVLPRRIVAFDELVNRPVRAGILLDTSGSMEGVSLANQAIGEKFVEHLFRQRSDQAFVSAFAFTSDLIQPWTEDVSLLLKGIKGARPRENQPVGTALFSAVFQACSSSFNKVDPIATGNFILLLSDGKDNAGLTSVEEAARACQRSNTEVFAFLPVEAERGATTGPKALRELASKTGGRVFVANGSEDAIWKDLKSIDSAMRNQYRLVYNPGDFKHDGSFHEIMVQPPDRVRRIEVRSGYFAPRQ